MEFHFGYNFKTESDSLNEAVYGQDSVLEEEVRMRSQNAHSFMKAMPFEAGVEKGEEPYGGDLEGLLSEDDLRVQSLNRTP